jgi:O-methyltransferase
MTATTGERVDTSTHLYLDLLKRSVLNLIYEDRSFPQPTVRDGAVESESLHAKLSAAVLFAVTRRRPLRPASRYLQRAMPRSLEKLSRFDLDKRLQGKDFPSQALTMIGMRRLDNIQTLVEDLLAREIPGDLIETGVWRGGSTIFMRGLLKAHGVTDRSVWVADSFEGPPRPGQEGMARSFDSPEQGAAWKAAIRRRPLAVMVMAARLREGTSYEEVRRHFARYGLLDDQVRFLRGWFHETLPSAPIERVALLRLDGDLYDSTYQALEALYPKLSVGGYAIVDDYGSFAECRRAVHDYLRATGTEADPQPIDDEAVYWLKRA